MKLNTALLLSVYCCCITIVLLSCASARKDIVRSFKKEFVFDTGYFQKVIPLRILKSRSLKDTSKHEFIAFGNWENDWLTRSGFLQMIDSAPAMIRSPEYEHLEFSYRVTEKAAPYLRKLHYNAEGKPDTAWFNSYRLKKITLDTFFHPYADRFDSNWKVSGKDIYDDKVISSWKMEYEATPLFDIYAIAQPQEANSVFSTYKDPVKNIRYLIVYFKRGYSKKKPWEIDYRPHVFCGIYDALNPSNSHGDYWDAKILFPPKCSEWLKKWWQASYFRSFR